jgi:hypothetical protein
LSDHETTKGGLGRFTFVGYKKLDDLVKLVSMSPQPFLNHMERDGRHFYFFVMPLSGAPIIYYFAADKKVEGEYITLNRMSGRFSSSNKPTFDAQSTDVSILEVDRADFLDIMK